MRTTRERAIAGLLAALFVAAAVIIPVLHQIREHVPVAAACGGSAPACEGDPVSGPESGKGHDAGHCLICQLAATCLTVAPGLGWEPAGHTAGGTSRRFETVFFVRAAYRLPFSCGPPA